MTIGVIVAHADDECLGMGGTIALLAQRHSLRVLILADGVTSRGAGEAEIIDRILQCQAASKELGMYGADIHSLPDNAMDTISLLQVAKEIENWLGPPGEAYDTIYTHHPGDLNVDHRIVAQAVLTATRPTPGQAVRDLFAFEVPSSTEWAFGQIGRTFQPNCFVDITETIETKLKALACYESEMRAYPHPRSLEAIRARAQYWGQVAGVQYAEAFQLIRGLM